MGVRAVRIADKNLAEIEANPLVNGLHVTADLFGSEPVRELIVRRQRVGNALRVACPVTGARPDEAVRHATAPQLYLPRTCHVMRYLVAEEGADRSHINAAQNMTSRPRPAVGEIVGNYGPLNAQALMYPEAEISNIYRGPAYGQWWPRAEYWTGDEWSPNPGAHGGKAIAPYQGVMSARYWWDLHCGIMDRSTCHLWDTTVDDMRLASGLVRSERYVIAGARPESSILPDGQGFASPIIGSAYEPLVPWQSTCGTAGYDPAHKIREARAAMALTYQHGAAELVNPDRRAMARDLSYWLCPHKAMQDQYGPGENPSYMYRQSLAYRIPRPQTIVRDLGWASYVIADGIKAGDRVALISTATALLAFWEAAASPSGFWQAAGHYSIGSPYPSDYGVLADELSAAEIEAPIALAGCVALALQALGEVPPWLVSIIDRQASVYQRMWPNLPKYLIVKKGQNWLAPADVRMCPGGPRGSINGYVLMEIALRFGSPATRAWVEQRAAQWRADWQAKADARPWAAGLCGALA